MSFVVATPDAVMTAEQDLAGIHSSLSQATAAATGPTTAIVAAAEDEVSAAVAALFGAFGQEYHAVGAQAAAFHEQLVGALNGTAAAYVGAEAENAQLAAAAAATGPYQALLQNSVINLNTLGDVLRANPVPFLNQTLINTAKYLNAISAQFQYVVQNFPALLAGAPGSIQAGLQGLLAFTPGTYLQQFITNQHTYANIWGTSLNNAAPYFFDGLHLLPSAFQAGAEQLLQGSVSGWVKDVGTGFARVFITGFATSTTGSLDLATNGTLVTDIVPTGTLGELLPILSVPGMRAEYLTSLLPPNTIVRQIAQNATNVINTATDASLVSILVSSGTLFPFAPFKSIQLSAVSGLVATLGIELVGGPYNALAAFGAVGDAFVGYTHTGNWSAAIGTLLAAPGVCTDAFLNGQSILPVDIVVVADVQGIGSVATPVTLNLPMDGLLVPVTPYTAFLDFSAATLGILPSKTVPVEGAPLSGLLTGLLSYAPQQLAKAITF